ncbi:hypothetical protein [Streptomyces sp. NPDC060194]|uniref:hypothetical protein n=1 Tax=Streptomyces sp. NPDC060194 TaxID=3347069 RepID=UPI003653F793
MLELTMAAVTAQEAGSTAGMVMVTVRSNPGMVVWVGRDREQCRLATPADWLFVSRAHLEFRCLPDASWTVTWHRGSQDDPAGEVRLAQGGWTGPLPYGSTAALPRGGAGEVVIQDRMAPRSVNIGWYHEG